MKTLYMLLLVTVAALVLLPGAARAVTPPDFTIVAIPDTQSYVDNSSYDPLFAAQTQWVVDTRNTLNTKFATHLGDIVEHGDQYDVEWSRASTHMATLDSNGVPNNVLPGNHDMNSSTGVAAKYDQYFPPSRYTGFSWYGGNLSSPVNRKNKDNYELFSVGNLDFIIFHLEFDIPDYVMTWAQQVMNAYPDRRVIISTHAFVNTSSARPTSAVGRPDGNSAEEVWQQLVKPN